MQYKRTVCVLGALLLAGCLSGCLFLLGGSAGAGAALWYKGELRQNMSGSKDDIYAAAKKALPESEYTLLEMENGVEKARIKAKKAGGTIAYLHIRHISNRSSRISIRVGLMGDEPESRRILAGIHNHL
ncbi:MAG: DUF3568 family protein [Desulfonatronovibrionaceae bacterium]